jgi:hypothetical protein
MNNMRMTEATHRLGTPKRVKQAPAVSPASMAPVSSNTRSVGTTTMTEIVASKTTPLKMRAPFQGRRRVYVTTSNFPERAWSPAEARRRRRIRQRSAASLAGTPD